MRVLAIALILFFAGTVFSFAREIFEGGYNGSYAEDGFRPDTAVDVFTGSVKADTRYEGQAYPVTDARDSGLGRPVYVAPIAEIINKQAGNTEGAGQEGSGAENTENSEEE